MYNRPVIYMILVIPKCDEDKKCSVFLTYRACKYSKSEWEHILKYYLQMAQNDYQLELDLEFPSLFFFIVLCKTNWPPLMFKTWFCGFIKYKCTS